MLQCNNDLARARWCIAETVVNRLVSAAWQPCCNAQSQRCIRLAKRGDPRKRKQPARRGRLLLVVNRWRGNADSGGRKGADQKPPPAYGEEARSWASTEIGSWVVPKLR